MLFHLVRKEILLNLVSFRFVISMVLLVSLVLGSMMIMTKNYVRRMDDYESSHKTHREDLEKMSNIAQFIAFGVAADPRPPLMGIFAVGLEQKMSSSFSVPGYNIIQPQGQGGEESPVLYQRYSKMEGYEMEGSKYANPIFSLFQPPDFVYVVNIILSLLAILFAYDCICGEKEDQTLKLMLTNAIPRDVVLLGKWIGGTLSILVPFLISFGLGIGLIRTFFPDVHFTSEAWSRVLMIMGTSALYIMVFFLMGMAISTFTERSSTSLIVSLFAWVFFVLVVPNIAPVIARQIKPITTANQASAEKESENRNLVNQYKEKMEKETKKENADAGEIRKRLKKDLHDSLKSTVETRESEWTNRLRNQTELAMNISRISPSANFVYASSHIAGTGIQDYFHFKEQVPEYKKALRDVVEDKDKKLYGEDPDKPFPPSMFIKMNMEVIPELDITEVPKSKSLKNAAVDLGILGAWLIGLFMASFIGFLRYDVK